MSHWLVELNNGIILLAAYFDAIFTLVVMLLLCGSYIMYDNIKRGLSRLLIP